MIDLNIAQQNAAREIQRIQQTSGFWGTYELGKLHLARESEVFWVFFAGSRELVEQAHTPRGLFVTVDKASGRIWTRDEIEAYYMKVAEKRQPIAA